MTARPPIDPRMLRDIVEGTAAETGEGFFDALVRHLARAVGTKCAWVTEWLPEQRRLRALAFWAGNDYVRDYEYDVAHTPCEPVIEDRRRVLVPDRVVELYARDPDLAPLGAVSYLGVPLLDTDGALLGHLAVMDDAPMAESDSLLGVFEIFAGRAAAELRRARRDRTLREREQQLSRLFDGAMDAIVELDADLCVTGLNAAASRLLGRPAGEALGRTLDAVLTPGSRGKLRYLTAELDRQPDGRRSLWIPDGLEVLAREGAMVPAEATLSRYEQGRRTFYSLVLRSIHDRLAAEERIRSLTAELEALHGFDDVVGESVALRAVLADVERVADTDASVLITGETGTGKELIARAIHRRSRRGAEPFVAVNCAAIPDTLQESDLFGHERGAFTGAVQRRDGRFKLADGGTLFLDEVGEMSRDLQAKLLRVLQEGEFEPVGSSRPVRVDVRVVAATNRDLDAMTREGSFREDLKYRLNVFPIHLPPLRERGDDVVLLAEAFAAALARKRGRTVAPLGADDRARLRAYAWPGNVRELQNVIERAFITSTDGRTLNLDRALPMPTPAARPPESPDGEIVTAAALRDIERRSIERALDAAKGKISGPDGAAALLGLNPNTLASRMKALGIRRR